MAARFGRALDSSLAPSATPTPYVGTSGLRSSLLARSDSCVHICVCPFAAVNNFPSRCHRKECRNPQRSAGSEARWGMRTDNPDMCACSKTVWLNIDLAERV
ncbi:hypothetical protein HPB50_003118 [Hyalomma asiaticum]|uniref:Uncharacterized protein n=1 Tax=Hyalomma asiaticum TaxID=266040 RepID=A0ACB7S6C7_HYAAI|nr:hypothetical protein HPB50_003118 [Hyalomma asiaticum]